MRRTEHRDFSRYTARLAGYRAGRKPECAGIIGHVVGDGASN